MYPAKGLFDSNHKTDISNLSPQTKDHLLTLLPTYESLALSPTSKIHLLQSLLSSILVSQIFTLYFPGLPPSRAVELERVEKYLSEFSNLSPHHPKYIIFNMLTIRNSPLRIPQHLPLHHPLPPPPLPLPSRTRNQSAPHAPHNHHNNSPLCPNFLGAFYHPILLSYRPPHPCHQYRSPFTVPESAV
jgi:hypothetical protein